MIRGGRVLLHVSDVARSLRFYIETLGFKLVVDGGPGWAVVDAGGGFELALHEAGQAVGPLPASSPSVGFAVRSVDEAAVILENRGVPLRIVKSERAHLAHFVDLDGNPLHLFAQNNG